MKTQVTFRHTNTDPELHEAAVELAKKFTRYHDNITGTQIEFINDSGKVVEFTVNIQGNTLIAKASSDDFLKSLNEASDKIVRQLKKKKSKMN